MEKVFIARQWRSLKYEDICLKAYSDGHEAKAGIAGWIEFYNFQYPHQALKNRAPMAAWRAGVTGAFGEETVDMALLASEKLGQRCTLSKKVTGAKPLLASREQAGSYGHLEQ